MCLRGKKKIPLEEEKKKGVELVGAVVDLRGVLKKSWG